MVKEGENKMNKNAIIRTQLMRYLKVLGLFLIIYGVALGVFLVLNEYTNIKLDFDHMNYLFAIYLATTSWIIVTNSLTFYSYHSFSRQSIMSRTTIVQLIVSLAASLLMEGHSWLMKLFPEISKNQAVDQVKNIYISEFTSHEILKVVLACLFTTLAIFTLLQLTDLVLIGTYRMKRRNAIILIVLLAIIVLGFAISLPYWSKSMIGILIMVLGFIFGTGQSFLPSIVIPTVLLVIFTIIAFFLNRRLVKKLEVYKNIFI